MTTMESFMQVTIQKNLPWIVFSILKAMRLRDNIFTGLSVLDIAKPALNSHNCA